MSNMPLMEVSKLSYRCLAHGGHGLRVEVDNLILCAGDLVLVSGANGCGKTTLLRLLAGVLSPNSGRLALNAKARLSYVQQRFVPSSLIPITMHAFLELVLGRGCESDTVRKLLSDFRLARLIDSNISQLSGGELRKLLLTAAFASPSHLLLLDEPEANLGGADRSTLSRLIVEAHHAGRTVVVVTHCDAAFCGLINKTIVFDICGGPNFDIRSRATIEAGARKCCD